MRFNVTQFTACHSLCIALTTLQRCHITLMASCQTCNNGQFLNNFFHNIFTSNKKNFQKFLNNFFHNFYTIYTIYS